MKKITALLLLILAVFANTAFCFGQDQTSASTEDEDVLFYFQTFKPKDYNFALTCARDILKDLKKQKYPYAYEAVCVVFPEMMRYSQFQNEIESLANELLTYASDESSGFSIGLFQMKPQFAQQIERIISLDPNMKLKYRKIAFGGTSKTQEEKHDRIARLNNLDLQVEYIKAFVEFEVKNLKLEDCSIEERIKYIATAYNAGLMHSKASLEKYSQLEGFPTGKRNVYVNYSKICVQILSKLK